MEFIYQVHDALSKDVCEEIINKYKTDDRKKPSQIEHGVVDHTIRKSTTLFISDFPDWKELDSIIYTSITQALKKYTDHINSIIGLDPLLANVRDEGYNIQSMGKNEFYDWHCDDTKSDRRLISCIAYLNDMDETDGGTTDFKVGCSIQPKQGSVLFFPSSWSYVHRGAIVKSDRVKYIIVTWMNTI